MLTREMCVENVKKIWTVLIVLQPIEIDPDSKWFKRVGEACSPILIHPDSAKSMMPMPTYVNTAGMLSDRTLMGLPPVSRTRTSSRPEMADLSHTGRSINIQKCLQSFKHKRKKFLQ